ncbi:MAG: energy transducer TonB [Flavobacteriia bacterium]
MSGCPECDREAVRVIQSMPKWKPGKIKGASVASFFDLPINFTLE